MDGEWIEAIGAISGGATEQAPCRQSASNYWQSSGYNPEDLTYQADLPTGIHFGCGLTPRIESVGEIGRMSIRGAGATLVICTRPTSMTTSLAPGPFHSAGLWIATTQIEGFSALAEFARHLGDVCMTVGQVPFPVISRLVMPIDPWFQGTARDMAREARALELLAVYEQVLCSGARGTADTPRSRQLAITARTIMDAEYGAPLTIAHLAERVGCSPRTLTEAFRQVFEISIAGYLTRHRLEQARLMLGQGARPTEVAYRVGYSPAHFATAFRRQFGVPPSRWRG